MKRQKLTQCMAAVAFFVYGVPIRAPIETSKLTASDSRTFLSASENDASKVSSTSFYADVSAGGMKHAQN